MDINLNLILKDTSCSGHAAECIYNSIRYIAMQKNVNPENVNDVVVSHLCSTLIKELCFSYDVQNVFDTTYSIETIKTLFSSMAQFIWDCANNMHDSPSLHDVRKGLEQLFDATVKISKLSGTTKDELDKRKNKEL